MIKITTTVFLLVLVCATFFSSAAQELQQESLTEKQKSGKVMTSYLWSAAESYERIELYKSNFNYVYKSNDYYIYSNGIWNIENGELVLNSEIDSLNVPVLVQFTSLGDSLRWRNLSNIVVPVNLKGNRFGDSRIFINNMSDYCFPYFDTCFGKITTIDSIKVDFGRGFHTAWIPVKQEPQKYLQVVVKSNVRLYEYVSFRKRRYKIAGGKLNLIQ